MSALVSWTDSVCQLNSEINNINVIIREKQMEVGAFRQKLEQITVLQKDLISASARITDSEDFTFSPPDLDR